MPKIRAKPKHKDEQCAVCKDGPSGLLMCRGCSTLIHAACLVDVRGCPTIGCNEADPLQAEPVVTDRMEAGPRLYEEDHGLQCRIESARSKARLAPGSRTPTARHRREEEAEKRLIAKAKATRMIPHCLHDFSPADNKCIHCKVDMFAFASKEFGSAWNGPRKHQEKVQKHDQAVIDQVFDKRKKAQKHWIDRTFDFCIEYGGRLLSLIFLAVCISIWLLLEFGSILL